MIMCMCDRRMPVGRIAAELQRHPATIDRELRRNFVYDEEDWFRGYFGLVTYRKAGSRRAYDGKDIRDSELASHIVEQLLQCWSPEQIVGCLRLDEANLIIVFHQTIYQYVYGTERRLRNLVPRLGLCTVELFGLEITNV